MFRLLTDGGLSNIYIPKNAGVCRSISHNTALHHGAKRSVSHTIKAVLEKRGDMSHATKFKP
jgi:hypothetical protein